MLDRALLRSDPAAAKRGAERKGIAAPVDEVRTLIEERAALLVNLEAQQAELNRISKTIGQHVAHGRTQEAEEAKAKTMGLKQAIGAGEADQREIESRLSALELQIPNIPHTSVPEGLSEEQNVVRREWGEKPGFAQPPQPHWDVAERLGMLDPARGAKIAGSGWMLYTGLGARLQRSLCSFMIDHHTRGGRYREVYPPVVVNRDAMTGTGQLPKFAEDMYKLEDEDMFLVPTAEVPVTNIYRDEILDGSLLTIRLAALSACFRREAGAAGKDTRGLLRMHQFDKVELVKLAKPEDSYDELETLVLDAEGVLQALGLHYRVTELCAGELSFSNAKCYDLELWSPALGKYLEISSCSNFEAFQARRAGIRFRRAQGEKPEYVHTLNGSGLATPRLFAAILETHQLPEGGLSIPEPLRPYMGLDRIDP